MAKLIEGFKDGRPELGRRTFLVPESHAEVLALLYHEQTGIVGGLPVGPVTTDPFGAHGIRMYPDQDPVVLEETRRYFEKLAERFSNDRPRRESSGTVAALVRDRDRELVSLDRIGRGGCGGLQWSFRPRANARIRM